MKTRKTRSKREKTNLRLELHFLRMSHRNLSIATHDALLRMSIEIQELKQQLKTLTDEVLP